MAELDTVNSVGMIEQKRKGLGQSDIVYGRNIDRA